MALDSSNAATRTTAQHVEALCASPQFQRLAEERQYGPAGTGLQQSNIEAVTAQLQLCTVRPDTFACSWSRCWQAGATLVWISKAQCGGWYT